MDSRPEEVRPFCSYCASIFPIQKPTKRTRIEHYPTLGDLVRGASQTACGLCACIQQHWPARSIKERFCNDTEDEYNATQLEFYTEVSQPAVGASSGNDQDSTVKWVILEGEMHVKKHKLQYEVHLVIATCNLDSPSTPRIWNTPGHTTNNREKHAVVKSWLSQCEQTHGVCYKSTPLNRETLPERLVKISLDPEIGELKARLVLSALETPPPLRYAALSHCWGNYMPLKTVGANLELHSKNIPMSCSADDNAMPRTFRDAIELCHSLGLEYLWIDSLCIVQDDLKEWGSEAARMKDVYSNATITIAASYAVDSRDGCFVDDATKTGLFRSLYEVNRFRFELTKTEDSIKGSQTLAIRVYNNELERQSRSTVLSRRGWTLQEQVLSRRIVHCTYPEIHWQCSSSYSTEAGVVVNLGGSLHDTYVRTMQEWQNRLSSSSPILYDQELQDAWRYWMENYSKRRFSFMRDQTAALAGLIQRYGEMTGFSPLLGCWEETLCRDLSWQIANRVADPQEPLPGIPSWSWLTRNRRIVIDSWIMLSNATLPAEAQLVNHAKLIRKKVVWREAPLLSKLEHAELVLRAPIKQFQISTSPETNDFNPPYVSFDDDIWQKTPENPLPWYGVAKLDGSPGATRTQTCNGLYTCLLLRSCKYRPKAEPNYNRETFLIVEQVGEDGDGSAESPLCYRRLGLGGIHTRDRENIDTHFGDAEDTFVRLI